MTTTTAAPAATTDTLLTLARLTLANTKELTPDRLKQLTLATGLTPEEIRTATRTAELITSNKHNAHSTLERDPESPANYTIRPETSAFIHIPDPNRHGYGYTVSIHNDTEGPAIEIWPLTPHQLEFDAEPLERTDWTFDTLDHIL